MTVIAEYAEHITAALGIAYLVARFVVAMTPTPKDDELLETLTPWASRLAKAFGLDVKQGRQVDDAS